MSNCLVEVQNLKKYFPIQTGLLSKVTAEVKAVDDVSFRIDKGSTFGLVGESGCGKTTVGRMLAGLLKQTAGLISIEGWQSETLTAEVRRELHKRVQIVFQDPSASLNPYMTVEELVMEPLEIYRVGDVSFRHRRVSELTEMVGLPSYCMRQRTCDFSSGQQQRVAIARALALKPELLVADEPVSVLDASAQAQILNLLCDLQDQLGVSYLFISHALDVVEFISHRVGVMYLGKLVETARREAIYRKQLHPYTKALFSAIQSCDPDECGERIILCGEVPSPVNPPSGCYFHPRCREAQEICKFEAPVLREVQEEHFASCHFA
jgi:oligopeptide/dipeptide ABC transporter ATP-binding protein